MTKQINPDVFAELFSEGKSERMMSLEIADASLQPNVTGDYLCGQSAAYRAFDVENAQLPNWVSRPPGTVSLVTIRDSTGKMIAGVRSHTRREPWLLPVEERIDHPDLTRLLSRGSGGWDSRAVELCGGWVARSHRKTGLSEFMFLGAVVLACVAEATVVCGCAHTAAIPLYERYGMGFDRSRSFAYPDERYRTFAGVVDLEFAAAPSHPAATQFAAIADAIREGRPYSFDPAVALDWDCPRAPALDWSKFERRGAVMSVVPRGSVAQLQL